MRIKKLLLALVLLLVVSFAVACEELPHTHAYGEWETVIVATCVAKGEEKRVCECGEEETRLVSMTDHSYGAWIVTTAPACAAAGEETRTCACGQKESRIVAATGHDYGEWEVITPANCGQQGEEKRVCFCTAVEIRQIPATGHQHAEFPCASCGVSFSEGLYFQEKADGTYTVQGIGTCTDTELRIPCVYNGKPVTAIGSTAFHGCENLISIIIPESVIHIYDQAFRDCSRLETVIVANGNPNYHSAGNCLIETASKALILGCNNSVIPTDGSVTSIGDCAYMRRSLGSLIIPDSVTSIGYNAFRGCSVAESIIVMEENPNYHSAGNCLIETAKKFLILGSDSSVIPDDGSVETIGMGAFLYCTGLTTVTIPDSVKRIYSEAFCGCSSLATVTIGNGVTDIQMNAFLGCNSLTTVIIPQGVAKISEAVFAYCSALTNISISEGITRIESSAFYSCVGLTLVIVPDGVEYIDSGAFSHCSNLTAIVLPNSVKAIGTNAFDGCGNFDIVYYGGTKAEWNNILIISHNSELLSATHYYYSETAPTEAGNYWHYVDGVPTKW
ncbi:MAG: leucine-rich repeat protein [Clostridia bacterium]|nr:leucine-rich repeat protein [Clostridia bacterium]